MELAATTSLAAAILFGMLAAFQVELVIGVPWGRVAWGGGQPDVLSPRLRVASGASAVILDTCHTYSSSVMGTSPPEVLR